MKLVVKNITPQAVVSISSFDSNKLYFFEDDGDIYKLHRISDGGRDTTYAFINMQTSNYWASGKHTTAIAAIAAEIEDGYGVYEFDSLSEALDWMQTILN